MRALALLLVLLPAAARAGELSPLLLHPPAGPLARPRTEVAITLFAEPDPSLLAAIRAVGGEPRAAVGRVLAARLPPSGLRAVASLPGVRRIEPAVPLVRIAPLHRTTEEIEAPRVWSPPPPAAGADGSGVVIADHEGGWDPFHPDFFRPDAGLFDFEDANGDGVAGPGDRVDLDGDGAFEATLSLLEGIRQDEYTGEPDYAEPGYQPDVDWLWADEDGDGRRGFGAGFADDVPALGEPILVGDDVDGDGRIAVGERLVRLGTSKIRAITVDVAEPALQRVYRRGVDLTQYPVELFDPSHGTGAIGIVAGGWPGLRRYTGVAPGAELVLVQHDDPVTGLAAAIELGATVHFHEWNSPIELHDGSSAIETAVSEAGSRGLVQVAAAGNLAGSGHCMQLAPVPAAPVQVRLTTQGYAPFGWFMANLTWIGPLSGVQLAILASDGSRLELPPEEFTSGTLPGIEVQAWGETSDRGTSRVVIYAWPSVGTELPVTVLGLEVFAPGGGVERLRGILWDDVSGWGEGVAWLDAGTDEGSALHPATADRVIAVAAHGGTHDFTDYGWGPVGERRSFSGMGPRIDGAPLVDVSGPDDPFTPRSDPWSTHGAYGAFGGTSGALPHVAGAAALLVGALQAGHDVVEGLLVAFAEPAGGDPRPEATGAGKIRVARALRGEPVPAGAPPSIELALEGPAVAGHPVRLRASVADPEGGGVRLAWDAGYDRAYEVDPGGLALELVPDRPGRVPVVARATDVTGRTARALLVLEVTEGCEALGCASGCCQPDGLCATCGQGGAGGGGGQGGAGGQGASGGQGGAGGQGASGGQGGEGGQGASGGQGGEGGPAGAGGGTGGDTGGSGATPGEPASGDGGGEGGESGCGCSAGGGAIPWAAVAALGLLRRRRTARAGRPR